MRFSIGGKAFKAYMDRAMAVIKPGSPFACMECVQLVAEEDGVYLKASTSDSAIVIKADGITDECGSAYIHIADVKRVYNMSGFITVDTSGKNRIRFSNGNKKSDVLIINAGDYKAFYVYKNCRDELFQMKSSDMLGVLAMTDAARESNGESGREILGGFNFDGARKKVITVDGYRMHAARMELAAEEVKFADFNRTICGVTYAQLKKILKNCEGDSMITAYDCDDFMELCGVDFTYYVKYIKGDFPDVYQHVFTPIVNRMEYSFRFDAKELYSIAKEYMRISSANNDNILYMVSNKNEIYTGMCMPDYRTADRLTQTEDVHMLFDGQTIAMNPKYVADAMDAIKGCTGNVTAFGAYRDFCGSNSNPMGIANDKLDLLILPVRANLEKANRIKEFVCEM